MPTHFRLQARPLASVCRHGLTNSSGPPHSAQRSQASESEPHRDFGKPTLEPRTRLRRTRNCDFIEMPRERGGGRVPFTEKQLDAMRGALTVEQYRWKTIRKWGKRS